MKTNRNQTRFPLFGAAAVALLLAGAGVQAQYSMNWSTIDCGGGVTSGVSTEGVVFTVTAVIGQPDAGPRMSGGGIILDGGFLPTGVAVPPACPTDLNNDGFTNTLDLTRFLSAFGQTGTLPADFNNDGTVNTADLVRFLSAFGRPCN